MKHSSCKRLASLAVCAALVMVTFFSTLFVVQQVNHTCHEHDCAICLHLHAAKRFIHILSGGSPATSGLMLLLAWVCFKGVALGRFLPGFTLISHKVRMNN